nr:Wzy polymerase domain-containing protein [uncultured Albidiferax sp.]
MSAMPINRINISQYPSSVLWTSMWSFAIAATWLLPNHYHPWATFHSDIWMAVMMGIAAAVIFLREPSKIQWHLMPIAVAALVPIPFIQHGTGLIIFSGEAWMSTVYLLGLLLTLILGARWESIHKGQATDALLASFCVASIISVGLQLYQFFGLDGLEMWTASLAVGRPSANLNQPNQLATLILWGILAGAWGYLRKKISAPVAVMLFLYLLFGIALTQSRTAWLGLALIAATAWIWRGLWPSRQTPWVVSTLIFYFIACVVGLPFLSDFFSPGMQNRGMDATSGHLRIAAYRMGLDALMQQPWWGYGLNQLDVAQLGVAERHPNLSGFFIYSHNLFLDFFLWFGIPLGGLISLSVIAWVLIAIRRVKNAENAVIMLILGVMGIHAMLEFPLHHAYFLLPTGVLIGCLNYRLSIGHVFSSTRWIYYSIWLFSTSLALVIARDYLRIETSYRNFRLEVARIGSPPPDPPPKVLVLNQLAAFIHLLREPVDGLASQNDIENRRRVTVTFPTPINLFNMVKILALHQQPEEAERWVLKIRQTMSINQYKQLRSVWMEQSRTESDLSAVVWPEE